ncbi:MAG TPA: CCA tRNA nucleotidyltransferase [Gemmataceae bacterium]
MSEREFAIEVVRTLQQAGYRALWAGGCVRDELLGLTPHDFDVATDARPEQVMKLFRRSVAVGAAFGVIEVIGPRGPHHQHLTVEVATFRSDGAYLDGRRPNSVTFSSPEEDAQRRDFTINGMFFDPLAGQLHDFVGGQADLQARVLRAIGDPIARLTEDKLRVLRAVRIAARFDLTIDPATLEAARRIAPQITVVSAERIAEELRKLLAHPNRSRGVRLLAECGLTPVIFPELPAAPSIVLDHLEPYASFPLAFAAFLQGMDKRGAEAIADRLKLSTAEKTGLAWLVRNREALADAPTLRLSVLKPILAHPGIGELLALHRAIARAGSRVTDHVEFCERMLRDTPPEELDPPPLVSGDDLITAGLAPGRDFKRLLVAVRDAQLEGQVRSKEDGLKLVAEIRSQG